MTKDYLVIAMIGPGGSSYARGPDLEDCVRRIGRTIVDDWSSLFEVAGKPCDVNIYDVTGHESVFWDHRGIHPKAEPETCIERLELRKITLPAKRRR